jgi:phospholipid-binding lipoprotein MlaA
MKASIQPTLMQAMRRCSLALAAASLLALGGCAAGPLARDPFEPVNRHVMRFNEGVDSVAFKPLATVYKEKVPPLIRTGVSNFFGNISDAWSFVNSLLQGKLQNAEENLARVHINTMFGLGGIFDVASEFNIERHREDFGQTLGRWGVPAGPYIVLPLLGPSTLRDTVALPVDRKADPLHDIDPWTSQTSLYLLRAVDIRSNLLRASSVLDEAALDKYSFIRDAYLQKRRADIFENDASDNDGQEPKADDGQEPKEDGQQPAPSGSAPAAAPGGAAPVAPPGR